MELSYIRSDRYGSLVSGTVVTHVGAPVAWGPRIIDTVVGTSLSLIRGMIRQSEGSPYVSNEIYNGKR
ncbi:hypothetical protein TNCV_732671 [Trichonephila clavipes]|nr:hypothetical protein TNCV_732671 [Trichonephila clavipes]